MRASSHTLCFFYVFPILTFLALSCSSPYPYHDQPIESINYWIGYYPDTSYTHKSEFGTIPLQDSVFYLDQYKDYKTSENIPIIDLSRLQLTFAFNHFAEDAKDESNPWRIANQGGYYFGTAIPVVLIHHDSGKQYGPYMARSTTTHFFDFKWGFKELAAPLKPGKYHLVIKLTDANVPSKLQEDVARLFGPKYYPAYKIPLVVN